MIINILFQLMFQFKSYIINKTNKKGKYFLKIKQKKKQQSTADTQNQMITIILTP